MKAGAESAHPNTCFATNWALPGICKVNSKTFQGGGQNLLTPTHVLQQICLRQGFTRTVKCSYYYKSFKETKENYEGKHIKHCFFLFHETNQHFFLYLFFFSFAKRWKFGETVSYSFMFRKKTFSKINCPTFLFFY